jgi:predicted ester cyclase
MPVLSVMSIEGQPDELVARLTETLEPVARRRAPLYGGISSTVVRTDDGITIFNLWQTEEGRHQMAEDPEVRSAIQAANFPEPRFTGYEVLVHNTGAEHAKEMARRIIDEVWTQGRLETIDELFAADYRGWSPTDGEIHGPEGFRAIVERYRSAFPNAEMKPDTIISDGEWVATKWTAHGTNTGELMGMPPTGKDVTVSGLEIDRIVGGKFVEGHGIFDALGMLQQMGVVPAGTAQPAPA